MPKSKMAMNSERSEAVAQARDFARDNQKSTIFTMLLTMNDTAPPRYK